MELHNVHILSDDEYNKLLNQSTNVFQEQRIIELEEELAKYKLYKRNLELDSDKLAQAVTGPIAIMEPNSAIYPFEIQGNILAITHTEYFVTLYNSTRSSSLTEGDASMYNYLYNLATSLGCELCWSSVQELKKHRTSLQKQGVYKPTKVKGAVQLTKL